MKRRQNESRISGLLGWLHRLSVCAGVNSWCGRAAKQCVRRTWANVHVADLGIRAGPGADDGDPPDNDGGAFGDQTFIVSEFWRGQMEAVHKHKRTRPTLLTWRWKCEWISQHFKGQQSIFYFETTVSNHYIDNHRSCCLKLWPTIVFMWIY